VTYTDQNVVGLKVDSPVRFKGVTVGRVQNMTVDVESRLIEIDFEIFLDSLMGLTREDQHREPKPDVRAYTIGNPITGEAYLLVDAPANPPPPMALDFEPDRPYLPSMPSPLAEIRDRLPELVERGLALVDTAEQIVARMPATLDKSDAFFTTADRVFRESDIPKLSDDLRETIDNLETLLGEEGTLNTFLESTKSAVEDSDLPATMDDLRTVVGDARKSLDRANLAVDDLRRGLPAVLAAIEQLRALARLIEEQSEAILVNQARQEESR
jgi:phospholipid/cholesterol/gamma-HCH transport system substrate-binding protein